MKNLASALLLGLLQQIVVAGQTPQQTTQAETVQATLRQFESPKWDERADAFYRLMDIAASAPFAGRTWMTESFLASLFKQFPDQEETIHRDLIRLAATENHRFREPHGEDYGNYFGDLMAAVGALHDPRAVDVLVPNIDTGGIVTKGLASLGAEAVGAVQARASDKSPVLRQAVAVTFRDMLGPTVRPLPQAAAAQVKQTLLGLVRDKDFFVRWAAVEALGLMPGDDVTALLKQIAESDPYHRPTLDRSGVQYPVREAAVKALKGRGGG